MPKKIIVCADGTWNDPEQLDRGSLVPTNVVKIARALAMAKASDQKDIFYDLGVGTGKGADRWLGGLTGNGLLHNIFQGYQFVAERYQPGDKIYLFGFSRGAYTVRSLAGLIGKFGLDKALTKRELLDRRTEKPPITTEENRPVARTERKEQESADRLRELRTAYTKMKTEHNDQVVETYKQTHECHYPDIELIGVWDTVGALGIPLPIPQWLMGEKMTETLSQWLLGRYRFLNVDLSPKVKAAYHALSIDENRKAFLPTLWRTPPTPSQTLKQVWFIGIHSNVGGGYADAGLSDNALHWMIEQAKAHDLRFCDAYLTRNLRSDAFYGEIRNERAKWLKRLLFQKGLRDLRVLCEKAGVRPVVAESVVERQLSQICKTPYKPVLPPEFDVERGF